MWGHPAVDMHSCNASLNAIDTELSLSISVAGALYKVCTGSRGMLYNPTAALSRLLYCGAISYSTMNVVTRILYVTRITHFCISIACVEVHSNHT